MKRKLFILSIFFLSCSEDVSETPDYLIEKEKFIQVIVDVHLLEEYYHRLYVHEEAYKEALDSATYFVFEDYGVNKEKFEKSLDYYSSKPDSLFSIYEAALDTINFRINTSSW